MIGTKTIEIDATNFIAGMASNDNLTDGGFSPLSDGLNLTITPGVLSFTDGISSASANLVGNIITSSEDPNTVSPVNRCFLATKTTDEDGTFYTFNGTTLTLVSTDTGHDYRYGISDMSPLGPYLYGTSTTYIFEWQVSSGTVTANYQNLASSYTNASLVPHPTIFYENNWFCGNGNKLLRLTATGGTASAILTLDTNQVIVSLAQDPGTGRMLISTITAPNVNDSTSRTNRVLYYDGFSNKPVKSVIVDEMITGFWTTGGTLYIGYGQNLGYWDGAGIHFVRKLNVSLTANELPYRPHMTNIGTTLYVTEGTNLLGFGEIIRGSRPVPRYVYVDALKIGHICNLGSNTLGIATTTTNQLRTLDLTGSNTVATSHFYTLRYAFPRTVTFEQVLIEYSVALPTNGFSVGTVKVIDSSGTTTQIADVTNTVANIYEVECPYPTIETRMIQFTYTPNQKTPIRRFTLFYTPKD